MKLYKIKNDIIIEAGGQFYLLKNEDWDKFINDDNLFDKMMKISKSHNPLENNLNILNNIEAPIHSQELWASGVTYLKSKRGRQKESKKAGGGDFYAHVYTAERPELFFKAGRNRIANPGGKVRIRKDSTWNVPEPELTLMITSSSKIVGYTIGNDMSSRSIEGENPLYLPQAKTYDGCAAIGPCIYIAEKLLPEDTLIYMEIKRKGERIFQGEVQINRIKRNLKDLVSYLYRECTFPNGSLLMTGTGVVPTNDFTLQRGDKISITIQPIGTLINEVE
jgi:2-dehydro-3-deoxy-D-arabinonate dehydratase